MIFTRKLFTYTSKVAVSFSARVWLCACLQIARKRHKVINTFKSPLGQTRPPPPLKHIALMPLSQIRRVLDLQDSEGKSVPFGSFRILNHNLHVFHFAQEEMLNSQLHFYSLQKLEPKKQKKRKFSLKLQKSLEMWLFAVKISHFVLRTCYITTWNNISTQNGITWPSKKSWSNFETNYKCSTPLQHYILLS